MQIDMSISVSLVEKNMIFEAVSDIKTKTTYGTGASIGCVFSYSTPIDATNTSKITYKLKLGNCYGGGSQPTRERFWYRVGVMRNIPSSFPSGESSEDFGYLSVNEYTNANTDYGKEELILEDITGIVYIVVTAHGWTSEIENIDYLLTQSGNIFAIGDWFKSTRYPKAYIDNFMIKYVNEGLSAYQITFFGEASKKVSVIGNSSGEKYEFNLNSKGKFSTIFFFELGESITITYNATTRIVILSDRKTSIVLPDINSLIPAMTSDITPSGECICSSKLNDNFNAYYAFNQIDCNMTSLQGCWLANNSDTSPYLIYDFGDFAYVKTLILDVVNNGPTVQKRLYIEGSADGENYHNILDRSNYILQTFTRGAHEISTHNLIWDYCRYIRIRCDGPLYGGVNQYACGFNAVQITGLSI